MTDAFAFMDDNPAEREQIRTALPEVAVIDLPCDPLEYSSALWDFPGFERLTFSKEDGHRTTYYAAQAKTSEAELNFQCKEDFYRFLNQEAEIASVLPSTLARISQLTQKTNQFNLTTRRYTEQQIEEIAGRVGCQVLSIRLRDRFGDHGLVGVAITSDEKATCEIDTLLLSCRVIGRTVETAFLSYIARAALKRGCRCLSGSFFLTKKNAPAYEFYRQHGFQLEGTTGDSSF
jgi:FkbH-like protein